MDKITPLSDILSVMHAKDERAVALVTKAYEYSKEKHKDQKRYSGDPYFIHVAAVGHTLAEMGLDPSTVAAGLLHDVVEDVQVPEEEIEREFGSDIRFLVDGVTKLGHVRLRNSKDKNYVENLRKMFIATSEDLRVMLIKLADRLHNMRTLEFLPEEKAQKIATETLEMYAPIAGRLGIGAWKDELEDLAFKIVDPTVYEQTRILLGTTLAERAEGVKALEKQLGHILRTEGVKYIDISGRTKRLYSLYNKLKKYDNDITKVYDIIALRVIMRSTADCYAALGFIHKHFKPVPGRVKDYIASPKPNGYQSLHTSIFDKSGHIFELQIRTELMHEEAERGIAAHWFYAEEGKPEVHEKLQADFFKELHAWQEEVTNPDEYLESLKIDFFRDRIFVLTPKGDVKDLPQAATVIDFAFSVHSDLGFYMMGAKINGKMASIYDELHKGDVVEIIKSKKPATVSRKWLLAAKTGNARGKIRHYLNEHDKTIVQRIRELKLADLKITKLPRFFRKQ
jgi:GTP pyrophosphokinase